MAIGRRVYGLAAILMGVAALFFRFVAPAAHAPAMGTPELLLTAGDAALILGGLAINLEGRAARIGAIVLAAFFALSVARQVPGLPAGWKVWVTWENFAETTAMCMGGLVAFSLLGEGGDARSDRIGQVARLVFGLCVLVFGTSEFVYAKYTASLAPARLPPSQMIWVYITGACDIAAGLAILSGLRAWLAAILVAAMYAVFGLLVWLPATVQDAHKLSNWTETGTNWLLVGAAWCVADSLRRYGRER